MARAPTTLDVFSALAEPKRREVLGVLASARGENGEAEEVAVTKVVRRLGWPQPQVSKHLAVLREVGLVSVTRRGRERLYSVNGEAIKDVHDWTRLFERFWNGQVDRIRRRAEAKGRTSNKERSDGGDVDG